MHIKISYIIGLEPTVSVDILQEGGSRSTPAWALGYNWHIKIIIIKNVWILYNIMFCPEHGLLTVCPYYWRPFQTEMFEFTLRWIWSCVDFITSTLCECILWFRTILKTFEACGLPIITSLMTIINYPPPHGLCKWTLDITPRCVSTVLFQDVYEALTYFSETYGLYETCKNSVFESPT